jgi:hypothetical protein
MKKKYFLIVAFLLLATQVIIAQDSTDYYAHLQSEHREVLKKWLAKKTWLRPAIEKDASKDDLAAQRRNDKSFFPYYVVGDFNQDGKKDFAVLLKSLNKDDAAIAVFNAPFKSSKPAYFDRFEKGYRGIGTLYIEYEEDVKMLYMSAYETHGFYLKPKGKKYVAYDPDDEENQ